MILLAGVFTQINNICRNFLWKDTVGSGCPGKVAWKSVCKTKKEGGLGIVNNKMWNIAAMGKYLWMISSKKKKKLVA